MRTPFLFKSYKPPEALKKAGFKVYCSLCVHRHIDPETFGSVLSLMMCPNPKVTLSRRRGDALIDRARSMEASRFLLKTEADILLFIDDDICFEPSEVVRMLTDMQEQELDIVGAPYVLKQDGGGHLTTKLLPENKEILLGKDGKIEQVRAVATGCMAIHRRVLEKMATTMPLCSMGNGENFYPFFQPFPKYLEENKKWVYASEDWAACLRAEDLGFKIWLDCRVTLKHAGRYLYTIGDLGRPPKVEPENLVYRESFGD